MKSFWKNIRSVYTHTLLVTSAVIIVGGSIFGAGVTVINPKPTVAADAATLHYADRVVARGYLTLLNRTPEKSGYNYWYYVLANNPDPDVFVRSVLNSTEYRRSTLGNSSNNTYINTLYQRSMKRAANANELLWWNTALSNGSASRTSIAVHVIENGFTYTITQPSRYIPCAQFPYKNDVIQPLCRRGSTGSTASVVVKQVPGSNIWVNEAWYTNANNLRQAALRSGFNLQAYRSPSVPSWMVSPGSWRSYSEQKWLYDNGWPANPPGRSMHEWGLAIDFSCNGSKAVNHNRACWDWLRANGKRYGVHNFYSVSQPYHSESWHFSSNSR